MFIPPHLLINHSVPSPTDVQKFTTEPADTSGAGDSTISLMCKVSNKEGFLSWRRDGFVISNETRITNSNPRFSIVGDTAAGEYNLQIVGAQESDEGIYECFVTASGSSPFINSKEAFLSVISKYRPYNIIIIISNIIHFEIEKTVFNVLLDIKWSELNP